MRRIRHCVADGIWFSERKKRKKRKERKKESECDTSPKDTVSGRPVVFVKTEREWQFRHFPCLPALVSHRFGSASFSSFFIWIHLIFFFWISFFIHMQFLFFSTHQFLSPLFFFTLLSIHIFIYLYIYILQKIKRKILFLF